jgi:hypothetical protein
VHQRIAHGRLAHAEAQGQFTFADLGAGRQPAADDVGPQLLVDLLAQQAAGAFGRGDEGEHGRHGFQRLVRS